VVSTHDVSKPSGASELAALALSHNGAIDVLINNAGIHRDASLLKVALEDWQAVIEVQLQAALLCTQAVVPHMKEHGGGSIVNTTSNAGLYGNYGQASTATALAGIYGLTRTCAIELQRHKVRVNAVAPLAKTRLTEQLPIFHQVDSMSPEHVAPVHLFLASALSADLTGVVLSVAGGRISSYKMVESRGQFKEGDGGIWRAEEIAEHWPAISKA
jgi:NAD(P)-dependent dehydrogenase (short-subunit alcohol dehydrogenase family)